MKIALHTHRMYNQFLGRKDHLLEIAGTALKYNFRMVAITDHERYYEQSFNEITDVLNGRGFEARRLDDLCIEVKRGMDECIGSGDDESLREAKIFEEESPLFLLKGREFWSKLEGKDYHILGIGYYGNIDSYSVGKDPRELITDIHKRGGIAIAPHTDNRFMYGLPHAYLEELIAERAGPDAIEWNGQQFPPILSHYNDHAERFASEHNIPIVATSDAHWGSHILYGYMEADIDLRPGHIVPSLKRCIQDRSYTNIKRPIPAPEFLAWWLQPGTIMNYSKNILRSNVLLS